jgi:hypothetical protein
VTVENRPEMASFARRLFGRPEPEPTTTGPEAETPDEEFRSFTRALFAPNDDD